MSFYEFSQMHNLTDRKAKMAIDCLRLCEENGIVFAKTSDKDLFSYCNGYWKKIDTFMIKEFVLEYVTNNTPKYRDLDKLIKDIYNFILTIIPYKRELLKSMLSQQPTLCLDNITLCFNEDGTYTEHVPAPEQYQLSRCPITKADDTNCTHMDGLLKSLFSCHQDCDEIVNYVYALIGYGISGLRNEPIIAFLKGNGANGKSTFLKIVTSLYSSDSILYEKIDNFSKDIFNSANLLGKKLIIDDDLNESAKINTGLLKQ